jgi:hypothetical protein
VSEIPFLKIEKKSGGVKRESERVQKKSGCDDPGGREEVEKIESL